MRNTSKNFIGKQEGERILYHSGQHVAAMVPGTIKVLALSLIWVFLFLIFGQFGFGSIKVGILFGLLTFLAGTWLVRVMQQKSVFYVTDRRVVRFESNTPFTLRTRSLSWNDAVKTKSFAPSLFWKLIKVGRVIIHSQSTFVRDQEATQDTVLSSDDIDLPYTYYYQDLGNYIDKVIYLYKTNPSGLVELKPFIPKPMGQRY